MRRYPATASAISALAVCAVLAACGRAEPPDLRRTMSESVSRLGVRPFYPLQEARRPGTAVMIDASIWAPDSGLPPWQETNIWLTAELEPSFEERRRALRGIAPSPDPAAGRGPRTPAQQREVRERPFQTRFQQSPSDLANAFNPENGRVFYRQKPVTAADAAPADALGLAAMPGYSLASVDQAALALAIPNLFASFLGSVGLRSTSYLRIEAAGVEIAEVPYDEFRAILAGACAGSPSETQFGGRGVGGRGVVVAAFDQFEQWRRERADANARSRGTWSLAWREPLPEAPVQPYLGVLRRVFYLRGIRFVTEDSRAAAAMAQAAVRQTFPAGTQPVPLPQVTVNASPPPSPPPAGAPAAAVAAQNAAIAGLQQQVDALRSGLATAGSNAQIAASFARATAVGVELVQIFDRPLAFGYQAFFVRADADPDQVATSDAERTGRPEDPSTRSRLNGFVPVCRRF